MNLPLRDSVFIETWLSPFARFLLLKGSAWFRRKIFHRR